MTIKPHSSFFKTRGILVGKNNPKFFREGTLDNSGLPFQAVNFGVKTSPEQIVYVESFGVKLDKAYAWSKTEKKSLPINWDERYTVKLPDSYRLITPDWDIIDKIQNDFNDGDSILITGELDYQESNDKLYVKQIVKNIFKTKVDVEFEAEGFEEEAIFTQEITINTVEYVKEEGKIYVNAFIFAKAKSKDKPTNITPAVFIVEPDKDKKFANNVMKLKYGDTIKVDGLIHSRAVAQEVEEDDGWGKKHKIINSKRREYEIIGAHPESYQQKLYKEEDIQKAYEALQPHKDFGSDDTPFPQDEDIPDFLK